MSKNEIVSMIETMNNYDELASKAKAKADAIRDALKEEMLRLDTEELNAGAYIVRYTSVISNRFDSTTFKKLYIPPVFLRHYPAFKNKNLNLSELARVCNLSRTTVYKYLSLLEQ